MRICQDPDCSGIEPCTKCIQVQNALIAKSMSVVPNTVETISQTGMGLVKEQYEAFVNALATNWKNLLESTRAFIAQQAAAAEAQAAAAAAEAPQVPTPAETPEVPIDQVPQAKEVRKSKPRTITSRKSATKSASPSKIVEAAGEDVKPPVHVNGENSNSKHSMEKEHG